VTSLLQEQEQEQEQEQALEAMRLCLYRGICGWVWSCCSLRARKKQLKLSVLTRWLTGALSAVARESDQVNLQRAATGQLEDA
jgi:hypothetical protein